MVQHDVVGLRKQRWVTLRDKGRREQVRYGSQNGPCPLFHGLVGVTKERSQALRLTWLPKLGSVSCGDARRGERGGSSQMLQNALPVSFFPDL